LIVLVSDLAGSCISVAVANLDSAASCICLAVALASAVDAWDISAPEHDEEALAAAAAAAASMSDMLYAVPVHKAPVGLGSWLPELDFATRVSAYLSPHQLVLFCDRRAAYLSAEDLLDLQSACPASDGSACDFACAASCHASCAVCAASRYAAPLPDAAAAFALASAADARSVAS
jgi:hypothetical protein